MNVLSESPTPAPAEASLMEDLIDIWFTPSAVFARRSGAGWFGPFAVSAVLLVVLYYAATGSMQGILDAEVTKAVAAARAENPSMTGEQLATMQTVMEKSIQFGGLIGLPVALFILGFGVWLVSRVLGGVLSLGGGIMVASFAYLPKALEMLLVIVQGMVLDTAAWTGRFKFSWGAGRFMEPGETQGLYNLIGRVDAFTIWVTILIALGLIHAAKVEKTKAYAGAAVVWILGAIPAIYQLATGK